MENEFIIKIIKDSKGNLVSLENMPIEAADSLKIFIESLSDFAKLHANISDVKLSLKNGSITTSLAYPVTDKRFDNEINDIVTGKSENNDHIKLLKDIQDRIKANGLEYSVSQKIDNQLYDLTPMFKSKDFALRRGPRNQWFRDVLFIEGNLYEAGGKTDANVHIEDVNKFPYTIDCSKDDAKKLNELLYENVYLSILRKYKPNKTIRYELIDIYLQKDKYIEYKKLYEKIILDTSLEKYDLIHDKIVSVIENNNQPNGELLKLMRLYNFVESDRGIIRTILMTLKRIEKDEKLTEMYNNLADILRAGNTHKVI